MSTTFGVWPFGQSCGVGKTDGNSFVRTRLQNAQMKSMLAKTHFDTQALKQNRSNIQTEHKRPASGRAGMHAVLPARKGNNGMGQRFSADTQPGAGKPGTHQRIMGHMCGSPMSSAKQMSQRLTLHDGHRRRPLSWSMAGVPAQLVHLKYTAAVFCNSKHKGSFHLSRRQGTHRRGEVGHRCTHLAHLCHHLLLVVVGNCHSDRVDWSEGRV